MARPDEVRESADELDGSCGLLLIVMRDGAMSPVQSCSAGHGVTAENVDAFRLGANTTDPEELEKLLG